MPRGSPTAERLAALETRAELGAKDREDIKETLSGIRKDLTALMGSTSRLEAIVISHVKTNSENNNPTHNHLLDRGIAAGGGVGLCGILVGVGRAVGLW